MGSRLFPIPGLIPADEKSASPPVGHMAGWGYTQGGHKWQLGRGIGKNDEHENLPLTQPHPPHRIAPNMLKSACWFSFYFYYGFRSPVAGGGA